MSSRRRWLWGAVFLVVLVLTVPHFVATNSGAYKLAITTAHRAPMFTEALGSPAKEGWFSEGTEQFGEGAKTDLTIPVHGSKRKGNLHVLAVKENGVWRVTELTLNVTETEENIDLTPTL